MPYLLVLRLFAFDMYTTSPSSGEVMNCHHMRMVHLLLRMLSCKTVGLPFSSSGLFSCTLLDSPKFGVPIKISGIYSTDDPKKTEHLLSLDRAKEKLQLFKANLMEEGSFDSVVDGCQGVFHTASPAFHSANDPQVESMRLFFYWDI